MLIAEGGQDGVSAWRKRRGVRREGVLVYRCMKSDERKRRWS